MSASCPFATVSAATLDAEAFYDDHVDASTPVIIRDDRLAKLKQRWSDSYLSHAAGGHVHDEVRLAESANATDFPLTKVEGERSRAMPVRDFLAEYRSADREINMYATNMVLPALRAEFDRPHFTALLDHSCASGWCGGLWLGAQRQHSALHRDFSENVHAVIEGSKLFTLFAPNESRLLYPRPEAANWLGHASRMPHGARTCRSVASSTISVALPLPLPMCLDQPATPLTTPHGLLQPRALPVRV